MDATETKLLPINWHSPHRKVEACRVRTNTTNREVYYVQVQFARAGYDPNTMRGTHEVLDTIIIATGLTYKAACAMRDKVDDACGQSYAQGHSFARKAR